MHAVKGQRCLLTQLNYRAWSKFCMLVKTSCHTKFTSVHVYTCTCIALDSNTVTATMQDPICISVASVHVYFVAEVSVRQYLEKRGR